MHNGMSSARCSASKFFAPVVFFFSYLNVNLTTSRILILHFKKSAFGDMIIWSSRVGSGWVTGSGPVDISGSNSSSILGFVGNEMKHCKLYLGQRTA